MLELSILTELFFPIVGRGYEGVRAQHRDHPKHPRRRRNHPATSLHLRRRFRRRRRRRRRVRRLRQVIVERPNATCQFSKSQKNFGV